MNPQAMQWHYTLRFYALQHPYVCRFIEALRQDGISTMLTLDNQRWRRDNALQKDTTSPTILAKKTQGLFFQKQYVPGTSVAKPYPPYNVDFDLFGTAGTYSEYNWELFFHIPLLIATRLMQDERHDEAMQWFHYIFNPTTSSTGPVPGRYWFFKPLSDEGKPQTIQKLLQSLKPVGAADGNVDEAIGEWRDYPFEPHRIARRRPGAYQKAVVMKYLDNLIAWGDTLFRRDTIESINEATQLYVLAGRILGPQPYRLPGFLKPVSQTYAGLRKDLDSFSNALVAIESIATPFTPATPVNPKTGAKTPLDLGTLAFCIPPNSDLLRYWETVADRLFKIRSGMNIEGVVRELPLFEPPIDPALLVRARAMGLNLTSALDDLSAPAPHYRFTFMLQKARDFCEELKQIGGLLLGALEKRDGEALGQLRATHEKALLKATLEIRKQQIKEAEETVAGLDRGRELAERRKQHYEAVSQRLSEEQEFLSKQAEGVAWRLLSQMAALEGSTAGAVPEHTVMAAGQCSGTATSLTDGKRFALIAELVSGYTGMLATIAEREGEAASFKGRLKREQQDRDLQIALAGKELQQYDKQIAAAEIRRQMAERELANQELQIEQADKVEDFLREKFTSQDLYGWMSSQLSAAYFQAYRLAYDMAKRAERAYRMELGIESSNYIQFGRWNSLRKGLLAGEGLSLDLRRLEAAYLDQNSRRYELTKHVSLARLDPHALIALRQTGGCEVDVPEMLFDLDYPGHYMRQIKSVSLTIPSVTGPYTTVSCTLTLLKHSTRRRATASSATEPMQDSFSPVQSIATSGGRNDAGLFELNFRDERSLPFEGAGAVGRWRIELPTVARQFDYETVADVILHISYTALEGGAAFRHAREGELTNALSGKTGAGLYAAFNVRHDFPNEWHLLRQGQAVSFALGPDRFPYFASVMKLTIGATEWVAQTKTKTEPSITLKPLGMTDPVTIVWQNSMGVFISMKDPAPPAPPLPQIALGESFTLSSTSGDDLAALWMIVKYAVTNK